MTLFHSLIQILFINRYLGFLLQADYGVPAMVIAWSGLSFAVQGSPGGQVPARVLMPNTWDVTDTWSVVTVGL